MHTAGYEVDQLQSPYIPQSGWGAAGSGVCSMHALELRFIPLRLPVRSFLKIAVTTNWASLRCWIALVSVGENSGLSLGKELA